MHNRSVSVETMIIQEGMHLKNKKIKEFLLFALFVFPAVIFVLFATDIPFVMNLYYSVFDWNGVGREMTFVGLDNFVKIFTNDSLFWKGVKFTLKFAVFYVIIVNAISLVVALVMSKEKKSSSVGRAFYYIPYIISLTAISLIWKFIFGPGFEALYNITGWEFFNWSWVGTPKLAFWVVVIMAVWQNVGFYMVNYIAGIIAVPKELKAIKKLCDVRMENFEENEEYKELSQHLIRNKKEVKALKRIEKILKEVSE